jgi:DNA-binding NarL/FixJ family response regulator
LQTLEKAARLRNAHPNVLPYAATIAECDLSIHLPTFAASCTTWTIPKGAMRLEDLPAPTSEQLERHRLRFGPECVDLAHEKRDARTLRADGKSIPAIARLLRISERAVETRLRAGESIAASAI